MVDDINPNEYRSNGKVEIKKSKPSPPGKFNALILIAVTVGFLSGFTIAFMMLK